MNRWLTISVVLLLGAAALMVALRYSEQQEGVVLIPSRAGSFDEGPELGLNLGKGDSITCRKLRGKLAGAVEELYSSFDEVRRFAAAYNGEVSQLQTFETTWRRHIVEQKLVIYKLDTCDDFSSQWALTLATWRDVFRFQKETLTDLRPLGTKLRSPYSEGRIESQLTALRKALRQ